MAQEVFHLVIRCFLRFVFECSQVRLGLLSWSDSYHYLVFLAQPLHLTNVNIMTPQDNGV
jgi:hypothetical protein